MVQTGVAIGVPVVDIRSISEEQPKYRGLVGVMCRSSTCKEEGAAILLPVLRSM